MHLYSFIVGSMAFLIQLYSEKYRNEDLQTTLTELEDDDNLPRIRTYDFIIVGGGAAGCIVANRLSEDYSVLLLEAGGNPVPATDVSALYGYYLRHPAINYVFDSVPQMYAGIANGGIVRSWAGKMMGGSGSHNALNYNRGHPMDYDSWARRTNDSSWNYQNVLKYFKKSEDCSPGSGCTPGQHGHGGLMTVDTNMKPMVPTWLKAGGELGFATSLDPNGPQTEGFFAMSVTRKNGRRVSSYTAFVKPIEKVRKNLRIERYSHVSEILINADKRAYGVAYKRHGIPQIAHASKEVIVSAGSFSSPILLMKSGIGPSKTLEEAGIPIVMDLPVGEGLAEHLVVSCGSFVINDTSLTPSMNEDMSENSLTEFHDAGVGILQHALTAGEAFIVSSRAKQDGESGWPDIQFLFNDGYLGAATKNSRTIGVSVALGRPKSKGVVKLNTTAYRAGSERDEELALIDYKFLTEPSDSDVILEGIKVAHSVMENTTAFQDLGAHYTDRPHPGCTEFVHRSDNYWRCAIHQDGYVLFHATGTCSMSGPGDKNAVVDSKLRVLGVSNLRVVDGSVIPESTNSNMAAPIIMVAEKASEDILEDWRKPSKV